MRSLILVLLLTLVPAAHATDACSMRAIGASADVSVTDGSSFTIESYFRSRDYAAIRHFGDNERVTSVEGPFGWIGSDDKFRLGGDFEKIFALGHQFHAFLLYFAELTDNQRDSAGIEFLGALHAARSGDYPHGGDVHLIASDDPARPVGIVFDFPDIDPIEVVLEDRDGDLASDAMDGGTVRFSIGAFNSSSKSSFDSSITVRCQPYCSTGFGSVSSQWTLIW